MRGVREEPNGSISYMKVYEKIFNAMAPTVYWDRIISNSLSEDVSSAQPIIADTNS